ncbi:MAG: DNA-directed RNA polymerase subunit beta' [Erysipelotrichaceae bacterium]|nr:DNA-directed RNA polymerase subunit beta' [Erysipelotrichaceae bacterium]
MGIDINKLAAIKVGLASPEMIKKWSHGEVTKPETMNYRSQKPEMDGLFCEKIFGPSKDYECHCGKYKKIRFQGIVCEKCGVEVTTKSVRRERMGHIELASPVTHIWYLKGTPSRMATILEISPKELEDVVYFVSHICTDPGDCKLLTKGEVLGEKHAREKFGAIIKDEIIQNRNWDCELDSVKLFDYKYYADLAKFQLEIYNSITNYHKKYDYLKVKNGLSAEYKHYQTLIRNLSETPAAIADELASFEQMTQRFDVWYNTNKEAIDNVDTISIDVDEEFKASLQENVDTIKAAFEEVKNGLSTDVSNALTAFIYSYRLSEDNKEFDFYANTNFISKFTKSKFGIGAEAIKTLLEDVNLDELVENIKAQLKVSSSQKLKRQKLLKRLDVVESFRKSGNHPEWMVLSVLPVIPPDLRPMLQLDGGRYAASDLNELYRRVLTRNIRLKKLLEIGAPPIITINEKRMLQEAVDALIDNGRRSKAVTGAGGRVLKSLSSALKGKQGRFRQNLLGKRVDYSGRSVIAVGPELRMYQCGIPREMAVQLFKPFIEARLMEKKICTSHKQADKLVDRQAEEVLDVLDEIIKDHPVLLNRAPTLHRLGIQAFETKLVDGRAIRLHPLVCPPFNADFDGDQMAVHVPLSKEAIAEARTLMLANGNILGPKDGKPITVPSQDMILGNYFITLEWTKQDFYNKAAYYRECNDEISAEKFELYGDCEGKVFASPDEVKLAYQTDQIHLQTRIAIVASSLGKTCFSDEQNEQFLITTVGKVIFNSIFPEDMAYINSATDSFDTTPDKYFVVRGTNIKEFIANQPLNVPFKKGTIGSVIDYVFKRYGAKRTSVFLDDLKDQGFAFSTLSGVTVSIDDINLVHGKTDIISRGDKEVEMCNRYYKKGLLSDAERHKMIVDIWSSVKDEVAKKLNEQLSVDNRNPFFMMSDSGARGSLSNFTQLAGMRGLMSKPSKPSQKDIGKDLIAKLSQTGGKLTAAELAKLSQMSAPSEKTIELPIKSSFREGLTVSEFFIATHGARKGMSDTALKTAESGYLTRRLVDVAHDVFVKEDDCHTDEGYDVKEIRDTKNNSIVTKFKDRIVGRYSLNNVYDPKTHELIVDNNTIITSQMADKIIASGIDHLKIRSLFGCRTINGVCKKCYGLNLATGRPVEVGETIGVMAAQSIGEPGTQLTMRTFHTGGAAGESDITTGLPRVEELFETRPPKGEAIISDISGTVVEIKDNSKFGEKSVVVVRNNLEEKEYPIPIGSRLRVVKGDVISNGQKITDGPINPKKLLEVAAQVDVERYIIKEVQKVYALAGNPICDKHVEVMIRKMLRKVVILDPGDSDFIQGSRVETSDFTAANKEILLAHGRPAVARPIVLGITKASLETPSFLSAASFQETTRVLTDAAIKGKIDRLQGLKENVIVGKLIPCVETIQNISYTNEEKVEEETSDNFDTLETTDDFAFENGEVN